MLSILENDIERKLNLIETLYKTNECIIIEDMITSLKCTRKTLAEEIANVNEKYNVIEYHRGKGLFFNTSKGVNFHFYYCTYLKESLYVEILKLILIDEISVVRISRPQEE